MDTVTKAKPDKDSLVAYKTLHNEKGEVTDYVIPKKEFAKYLADKEAREAFLKRHGGKATPLNEIKTK